jgi:hypothetical protein
VGPFQGKDEIESLATERREKSKSGKERRQKIRDLRHPREKMRLLTRKGATLKKTK